MVPESTEPKRTGNSRQSHAKNASIIIKKLEEKKKDMEKLRIDQGSKSKASDSLALNVSSGQI